MRDIEALFTDISPTYDRVNRTMSLGRDLAWRKQAVAFLPFSPDMPLRALDLCAGTLDFSLALGDRYPRAHIDALDFSEAMLALGRQKIPAGAESRFALHAANALATPFPDASFDLVLSAYGMRNLPNPDKALDEVYRVLKPGGLFGALEFFKPSRLPAKVFYATYGRFALPLVGGLMSGKPAAYRYLAQSIRDYQTLPEYAALLSKHHLVPLKIRDFMGGISSFIVGRKA